MGWGGHGPERIAIAKSRRKLKNQIIPLTRASATAELGTGVKIAITHSRENNKNNKYGEANVQTSTFLQQTSSLSM